MLFFIAILIGGRGSILGPLLGTIVLTLLPEFAAPLAAWSTFLYAVLLLAIVLAARAGSRRFSTSRTAVRSSCNRAIVPRPALLAGILPEAPAPGRSALSGVVLASAACGRSTASTLEVRPGQVHGLIGPNGSGKTTTLNVVSGYYGRRKAARSAASRSGRAIRAPAPRCGIARTFQTPRIVGEASVLENVMIGGTIARAGRASPRRCCRCRASAATSEAARTAAFGSAGRWPRGLANVRADRLQHSELRFIEIARALMLRPAFLLLDEPAAGLSTDEIKRLGELIRQISRRGAGVLLVEHHADLIFDICDHVTVLNLGRVLAAGTPAEIRVHKEVVSAYLGG